MPLCEYLKAESVSAELGASGKEEALEAMITLIKQSCPGLDRDKTLSILKEREALGSTGIGDGVAIPHGKLGCGDNIVVAVARSVAGCDFDAVDGRKCHIFCLLLAPESSKTGHLSLLARFARIFKRADFKKKFMEAPDSAAIWKLMDNAWVD